MEALLQQFSALYPLSAELVAHLRNTVQRKELGRKEYLLKAGHVCHHVYFLQKGLLRCFTNVNDHEVCTWFMKTGDFVISVDSFFDQKQADESIQALEPCELYYLDYQALRDIYDRFTEFNIIGRQLTEKYYQLSEKRNKNLRFTRAEDRYKHLQQFYPELIQLVPQKHLASYLNITEETLSRIRRRSK